MNYCTLCKASSKWPWSEAFTNSFDRLKASLPPAPFFLRFFIPALSLKSAPEPAEEMLMVERFKKIAQ